MKYIPSYSESLVLSLCNEIEYIKSRSKNINYALNSCQNKILINRLKLELNKLTKQREIIFKTSKSLFLKNCNNLSIEFLFELSKRSTYLQQI